MKAWRTAAAGATAMALALALAASGREGSADDEAILLTHGGRDGRDVRFMLAGQSVTGIYPGARRQIKATVVNPFNFPLELRALNGRLVETSRRRCPATSANLKILGYSGRLPIIIRPHARKTLVGGLTVVMPRHSSPACSNTRFTIALSGNGRKAAR